MADIEVTSTSQNGLATRNVVGDWELTVDATQEEGPDPVQVLVADYVSCFVPAFNVGARREGIEELGTIEVTATAELDEDDDLAAVAFDIAVEADLGDATDAVIERAEGLCHVHDALHEGLHADVTVTDGADL